MQRIYEAYIESLSESVDERDLVSSMALLLNAFEVGRFAYLSFQLQAENPQNLISNYPSEWTSFYLQNRYEAIDPVVKRALSADEPFCWGSRFACSATTNSENRLFDEAARFGICSGLTVPIHDRRGRVGILTFAADEDSPALLRMLSQYQRAFQLVAACFHIQARRMQSSDRTVNGVRLTRREFECLQWAAKGKSAWEIGSILGIKRRTVAFHLDNTRQKLGVRTIAQAIARWASTNRTSE